MAPERRRVALISGITGQDGSYLADLLVEQGYEVHGLIRRVSTSGTARLAHLLGPDPPQIQLHYAELTEAARLAQVIEQVRPDELYHLAAQSEAGLSFELPAYTAEITGLGTLRILEAVRASRLPVKVFHAASSEMYGVAREIPQNEATPFYPRSPYGVAKVFAYWTVVNYREAYGMFVCNGILFNHESPRRGENFVTRKITRGVARIAAGLQPKITLGDLTSERDWGYAPDYVRAMWLMLQQNAPDDYVVATGETHSVEEFVAAAFAEAGLDWRGYVEVDARYFRPVQSENLRGDAARARARLGWAPATTFQDLVRTMVHADMALVGGREGDAGGDRRGR